MKTTTKKPRLSLGNLRISTDLALNPDAIKNPTLFALSNNVDFVDYVWSETVFGKDRKTKKKVETMKTNIPLVHHKAIRLFIENDGSGYRLRSIVINPSELLFHTKNKMVTFDFLQTALGVLKSRITPLLANPADARHIIPVFDGSEDVAYWSAIEITALFPNLQIHCFHNLSHPLIGPAEGVSKERIELRRSSKDSSILFEKESWDDPIDGPSPHVDGISVSLKLTGKMLVSLFDLIGETRRVRGTKRLVWFCIFDAAYVFEELMRQLIGTYLPVPPEYAGMGKSATYTKPIALLPPSESAIERFDDDVPVACLKPIPAASLFTLRA